jgi:predicted acyltransferase
MAESSSRVVALDVLRGIAVAGMILVTSPGDWNNAYAQLRHADWNAFVLSTLLGRFYGWPLLPGGESPQHWLNDAALRVTANPYLASLLCALFMLALVTLALWPLHRRAIHFRL